MESGTSTIVDRSSGEDPKERWARETRAAIEFEEDPHKAALEDDPELVYVGPRTWAAVFVSHCFPKVVIFSYADLHLRLCPCL